MPDAKTFVADAPAWIDLSSKDAAGSRDFYSKLFGWKVDVQGPEAGGYALAKKEGKDVAGIGPSQDPNAPTAWMVWAIYFTVADVDKEHKKAVDLGAQEMVPPQDFPGGRFSILSDPQGAQFGLLKQS